MGKSALIKLLIEVGAWPSEDFPGLPSSKNQFTDGYQTPAHLNYRPTPIVGALGDDTCPTSADVHLYADPRTLSTATSNKMALLYAECEGLKGGEQNPKAVQCGSKQYRADIDVAGKIRPYVEGVLDFKPEKITWADGQRQLVAQTLYPRLLYSFSDVVVFVVENAKYRFQRNE